MYYLNIIVSRYKEWKLNRKEVIFITEKKVKYSSMDLLKFVLFAAFGIFMFFIPIVIGEGSSTIPIDHIVGFLKGIPNFGRIYALIIVILGAILPFVRKTWNKTTTEIVFSMLKLLGIPLVIMAFFLNGELLMFYSFNKKF